MANPQLTWMHSIEEEVQYKGLNAGLNAGIEMDVFFAENYAFSTGLFINTTGGKLGYQDTIALRINQEPVDIFPDNQVNYRLQYLAIPLGLKLKTIEIGYTTYWVNAGLTPMINIRSKLTDEGDLFEKANGKEEISLLNMNYFIKAGVEYSLGGSTAFTGGIGYYHGFMDATTRSADKIYTHSVALILGILF
jgi:hypothetical protein